MTPDNDIVTDIFAIGLQWRADQDCPAAYCSEPEWCLPRGRCGWFGIQHPDPQVAAPRCLTP